MEEVLEAHQEVMGALNGLSREELRQVQTHLKMAGPEGEGRLRLLRKITAYLASDQVEGSEDEGLEVLLGLSIFIKESVKGTDDDGVDTTEKPEVAGEDSPGGKDVTEKTSSTLDVKMSNLLRREFKITGQVGEPGQKDRLTFTSLAHQIEAGIEKGYPDRDIVQGVIRAIVPGSPLRSYLEGRSKIPLPSLRRIVRSHFQERDATDLFKQLSQLAQDSKESPQAFLLRAFDIRQKVLFASQEVDSKLCYEPKLVREMFRHSILTGLRSDAIKTELRPYLDNPETSDETLFEKLNVYASLDAERKRKLKPSSVNEVTCETPRQKDKPKQGDLMAEIAALRAGVAELAPLKSQVAALQQQLQHNHSYSRQGGLRPPSQRRGCEKCHLEGNGETCNHCYQCGSPEHFARGCRQRRRPANQGNDKGLPPRDRERPQPR